jgi:large subunit ribosomal protein L29
MSPNKELKSQELRGLSVPELQKKLLDLRQEKVQTGIQKANQQLKNPLKMRALRRGIARILTIIKEKNK